MLHLGGCLQRVQIAPDTIGILQGSLHLGTPSSGSNAMRRRRRFLFFSCHHESDSSLTMLETGWLQVKHL